MSIIIFLIFYYVFLLRISNVYSQDTLPCIVCEDQSPRAGWSADEQTNTLGTMFGSQITETPSAWVLSSSSNVKPGENEAYSNCVTGDLPVIYLSGYDDEIFDLIKKMEDEGPGDEVKVVFYMFYKCKYYYLGYLNTTLKILKKLIRNSDHYYALDKLHLNDYNADIHCKFIEENIIRSTLKKDLKELLKSSEIREDIEIDNYLKSLAESDERLRKLIDDVKEEKDTEDLRAVNEPESSDYLCERQLDLIPICENEKVLEPNNICPNTENLSKAFVNNDDSYSINNLGVTNVDQVTSYTNFVKDNFKKGGYTQSEDKICSLYTEVPNYSIEKIDGTEHIVEPYQDQKTNNEKYVEDNVNYETVNDIEKQNFCKNDLRTSIFLPNKISKENYNGDSKPHTFGIHPCYSANAQYSHPELLTRESSDICRKYSKNNAANNQQKIVYQPYRKTQSPFGTSDIKYSVNDGKMFNCPYKFHGSNLQNDICTNICPGTMSFVPTNTEGLNKQICSPTLGPLNSNWSYKYMPYAEQNTGVGRNIAKIFGQNYLNCDMNPYSTSFGSIHATDWCNRPCAKENKNIGKQNITCSSVLDSSSCLKKFIPCICDSEFNFGPRISTNKETICSSNYAAFNENKPCYLDSLRRTSPNWSKKYIPFTKTTFENNNYQNVQCNSIVRPVYYPDWVKNCVPCPKEILKTNKNNYSPQFGLNVNPCMKDIGFYGYSEPDQLYDSFKKFDRNTLTRFQTPNIINQNVNSPYPNYGPDVNIQPAYRSNIIKPQDIDILDRTEYLDTKANNIAFNIYKRGFHEHVPTICATEKPIFGIPTTNTPYTSPNICDRSAPIFQPFIKTKPSVLTMDILPNIKSQFDLTINQETVPILKRRTQIPPMPLLTSTTTPIIHNGIFSKSNGVRNFSSSQAKPCSPQLTPQYPVALIPTCSEITPQYSVLPNVTTSLIQQYPVSPNSQSVIPRKIVSSNAVFPKITQYSVPLNSIFPSIIPQYPISITSSSQKIPQQSVSPCASFLQVMPQNSVPPPIFPQYAAALNSILPQINFPQNISLHSDAPRQYPVPKDVVSAQVKSQYSTPSKPLSQQEIPRQQVPLSPITPLVMPQYAASLKSISSPQQIPKNNSQIMPQYLVPFTSTFTTQVLKQHPVPLSPISPLLMPYNPITFTSPQKTPPQSVSPYAVFPQVVPSNTVPLNLISPQVMLQYPVSINLPSVQERLHIAPLKSSSQQRTPKQPIPLDPISLLVRPQYAASINLTSQQQPVQNISPCATFPQIMLQKHAASSTSPQYVDALNSISSSDNIPQSKNFHPNRDSLLECSLSSKDRTTIHRSTDDDNNIYEKIQIAIPRKNINIHSAGTKEQIQSMSNPLEISPMIPLSSGSISPKSPDHFTSRCKASIFYSPTRYSIPVNFSPLTRAHDSKYVPLTTQNTNYNPRTTVDLVPFIEESAKLDRYVDPRNLLTNKHTMSYESTPCYNTTSPNVNDLSYGQYTFSPNLLCVDSLDKSLPTGSLLTDIQPISRPLKPVHPVKYTKNSNNFISAGSYGGIPPNVPDVIQKLTYQHRPVHLKKHSPLVVPASKYTIPISDLKPQKVYTSWTYSPQNYNSFLQSNLPLYSPKSATNPFTYNPTKHDPTSKFSSFEPFPTIPFTSHIPYNNHWIKRPTYTSREYASTCTHTPKYNANFKDLKNCIKKLLDPNKNHVTATAISQRYSPFLESTSINLPTAEMFQVHGTQKSISMPNLPYDTLKPINYLVAGDEISKVFSPLPSIDDFKVPLMQYSSLPTVSLNPVIIPNNRRSNLRKEDFLGATSTMCSNVRPEDVLKYDSIPKGVSYYNPVKEINQQLQYSPDTEKITPFYSLKANEKPICLLHNQNFIDVPDICIRPRKINAAKELVPKSYDAMPFNLKEYSVEPYKKYPISYIPNKGPQETGIKTISEFNHFSKLFNPISGKRVQISTSYAKHPHVESTNVPESQYPSVPKVLSKSCITESIPISEYAPSIIKNCASHISSYSRVSKSPSSNFVETRDFPYSLYTPVPKTHLKIASRPSKLHVKFSEFPKSHYHNNIQPPTISVLSKTTEPEQLLSPCDESTTFPSPSRSSRIPLKTRISKINLSSPCLLTKEIPFKSNAMLFNAPLSDSCIRSKYCSSNTFSPKTISSSPCIESTIIPCDPTTVTSPYIKNTGIPLSSYTLLSNIFPLSSIDSSPTIIPLSQIEPLPKIMPSPSYVETKNIPYPAFVSKLDSATPCIDTINAPVTSYESITKTAPSTPYHKTIAIPCISNAQISKVLSWPRYHETRDIPCPKYTSDYKTPLISPCIQTTKNPGLQDVQDSTPPSVNSIITSCDPYTLSAKLHLLSPCIQSTSIPCTSIPVKLQSRPCGEIKEIPNILTIKVAKPLLQASGIQSNVPSVKYTSVPRRSSSITQLPYVFAPNTLSFIPHFKSALVYQPQPVLEYNLPAYKSDSDKNTVLHTKPLESNLLNAYTYRPNSQTSICTNIYPAQPDIFGNQVCNIGHSNLPVIPKQEKFLPTYVGSPPKVQFQNNNKQNGLTVTLPNGFHAITAYSPIFGVSKTKPCRPINYLEKTILSTSNTISPINKKKYPYAGTSFNPPSPRAPNIQMQQDIIEPISIQKSKLSVGSGLMSNYPISVAYHNLANKQEIYNKQKPCITPYKWDQYPSITNKPFAQTMKSNVEKFINSNCAIKDCIFNGPKQFEIPLGKIGIAKYSNNLDGGLIKTENPCIDLKIWTDKVKIVKAKICFETEEKSVVNFMPVVNKNCKLNPDVIQNIAKNVICKYYGCNPIVLKGWYTIYHPYAVIYNPELLCINSGSYYILWPTYCDCGCGSCGCKCCWQPGCQYCN